MFLQLLLVHMYLVMKTGIREYRTTVIFTVSARILFMMNTLILKVHFLTIFKMFIAA